LNFLDASGLQFTTNVIELVRIVCSKAPLEPGSTWTFQARTLHQARPAWGPLARTNFGLNAPDALALTILERMEVPRAGCASSNRCYLAP